jgi:hypothetical protein
MKCLICNKETNGYIGLCSHIHLHNISSKEYYDKYLKQENEGKCLECGKETLFKGIRDGYRDFCCCRCSTLNKKTQEKLRKTNLERYGTECVFQSEEVKNKIKETNLKRLGVDVPAKSKIVQDKMGKTNLKRYGHKAPMQSKSIQEKAIKTNLRRRGVKYPGQSEEVKEKIRKTNLERYGVECSFQSEEVKEKIKETNLKRYNAETWRKSKIGRETLREITGSKEFKQKCYDTKKKNNTFNKSKIEKELEIKLRELFSDLKTQYKSEVYPFACDYYVPSLNLYIEYNGTWLHGGCFYDENNKDDRDTLEKWKQLSEHSRFYETAVSVWTQRDILKLNTAIKNNLNYIAWFNQEQAYDWINAYKKSRTN